MAIVQISRIQIRRGQKNQNEGLPQLASGELAWAIDSQELYIGNGSLSEGAPFVGNTKVLTQSDDLFELAATYIYKKGSTQTGDASSSPVARTLQDRLDDMVSIRAFGATGDFDQDATPIIQRAIDQLYLTAAGSVEAGRITINFEPGHYKIHSTIFIPPFTTLVGAGPEKTVIELVDPAGTEIPIFKTVNGLSEINQPSHDSATDYGNAPREILIKGFTIKHSVDDIGLHLASCRDSIFENLHIIGPWNIGQQIKTTNPIGISVGVGIVFDSLSPAVRSTNNKFNNCKISGWSYGISANQEVNNNIIENTTFQTLGQGVDFGSWVVNNEHPKNNIIKYSKFQDIQYEAIKIIQGSFNSSQYNHFRDVGNDGGSEFQALRSIIKFESISNQTLGDYFYRTDMLSQENFRVSSRPYVPEVSGATHHIDNALRRITIIPATEERDILKLPGGQDQAYIIKYYLFNALDSFHRVGTITILCDTTGGLVANLTDEYEHIGTGNFNEGDAYISRDITFYSEFVNDGSEEAPVYSVYLKSKTGNQVQNASEFRYTIETRRFTY